MNANKVNIVLINSLPRHDLLFSSCVNNEVAKFNRQLKKVVKLHANVEFLEVKLYGQHLNNKELAKSVEQLVNKMKTAPMQMQWKEDNLDIHSNIVKTLEPFTAEDSLLSSKGELGKTRIEEVLSYVMDQQVPVEEVGRKMRQFKRVLRSYLVQHMFYSVEEYMLCVIRIVCLKMYDVSYVSNLTKRKNKELN
jgi:hypothetical protein